MHIRNVLIVGGGTAGWMTAAALLKLCPYIKVSLIESKNYPIIGVGESTLGQINDFFHILGLKDEMWMKETGSTYKVNIRFNDFYKQGETWDYPFGKAKPIGEGRYPHGWMSWFALNLLKPDKYTRDTFSRSHNPVGHLAWHNKLTGEHDNWNVDSDTAYHMDAIKFGQWLKNNYCEGLNYMQGDVAACEKDERGYITTLITKDGERLEDYDLFVDCTGFKSLLLEQFMGVDFVSFHHNDGGCLLNDSAVTCHMPHHDPEREITNTTNCTAIENGWVWDVPLWERSGCGYVYSSDWSSKEKAEEDFHAYLARTRGIKRADDATFKHVPFKNGKHKKSWHKNVCAIGLSNCFVEPLEATGLLTTHEQIIRLCNNLVARDGFVPKIEVDMLNLVADLEIEGFKNFIAAHYAFTQNCHPYWEYVANEVEYDMSTASLDNLFVRYSSEKHVAYEWVGDPGHNDGLRYVGAGMGFNPLNTHTLKLKRLQNGLSQVRDEFALHGAEQEIDRWNQEMYDWCMTLPSSYQYQKETIYKE